MLQAFVVVTSLEQSTQQHVFVVGAGVVVGRIAPVGGMIESGSVGSTRGDTRIALVPVRETRGNRRRCGVTTVEAIDDAGGGSCGACIGVWKSAEESPQRKPRLRARAHKVPNAMHCANP